MAIKATLLRNVYHYIGVLILECAWQQVQYRLRHFYYYRCAWHFYYCMSLHTTRVRILVLHLCPYTTRSPLRIRILHNVCGRIRCIVCGRIRKTCIVCGHIRTYASAYYTSFYYCYICVLIIQVFTTATFVSSYYEFLPVYMCPHTTTTLLHYISVLILWCARRPVIFHQIFFKKKI